MAAPLSPFDARPLIAEVDTALEKLLRRLEPGDWERPAVGAWRVRHVAAHLLDTSLRRLAMDRDGWRIPEAPPIEGWSDLVAWLDGLNAEWTGAAERLSPALLIELLAWSHRRVQGYFATLDLDATAAFPVAWAGENRSVVWMDLARELTERWLHQQQIRDATGHRGLQEDRYLVPILETFARALPRAYTDVEAAVGTGIDVEIAELPACRWRLVRGKEGWLLLPGGGDEKAAAAIRLPADAAWRLFVKGITGEEARRRATLRGAEELTGPFFGTIAIMG